MKKIKSKNKIVNITPISYMCGVTIACPAVYSLDSGDKLAITGKKADPKELGIADKVSNDEQVVIVDREMLRHVFEK